jgi:uncharacterized repeat protein (TIGR03803 family)
MKTLLCAVLIVLACNLAFGQTYKVLWSFDGYPNDGAQPVANLVMDKAGNLYGTTEVGGAFNSGAVFELSPGLNGTWQESVIYSFCAIMSNGTCVDGWFPVAGLIVDQSGNLYGTTKNGGSEFCPFDSEGCGTLFELSPPQSGNKTWTETVLYNFCAVGLCDDGEFPTGQLTFDATGNLYGTTSAGGPGYIGGTVFELSPGSSGWTLSTLYTFCLHGQNQSCPDGNEPEAGVTFDSENNLYGTTEIGGAQNSRGSGTVYELSPVSTGWEETVLVAFRGLVGAPLGTVSFDPSGNLYSTTYGGPGSVFQLDRKTRKFRTFAFKGEEGGISPAAGVLVDVKSRALYGTAAGGGTGSGGAVFKLDQSGRETVLYSFCAEPNCADGQYPHASLIEDKAGNLYGTTQQGGANNEGVVFEIVQSNE